MGPGGGWSESWCSARSCSAVSSSLLLPSLHVVGNTASDPCTVLFYTHSVHAAGSVLHDDVRGKKRKVSSLPLCFCLHDSVCLTVVRENAASVFT